MTLLLETLSHEKPPKGSSHPVNTEQLSAAFSGTAQFADIRLTYLATEGPVMNDSANGTKIHGAAAKSLDGYREFIQCSWSRESAWSLIVHSVPSNRKSAIAHEASKLALPLLTGWLTQNRSESWFIGSHHVQIGISEFSDELAIREIHNDRIVKQQEFLQGERSATG